MKTVLKRTLALLLVLALTLGTVYITDRVLLLKRYDGVKPMQSFYAQTPGTVDVLLLGNSHMGVHVDTATLWQEYGISALDWGILLAALGLLGLISALREKGYDSGCVLKQGMAARALVCWALFMSIVIFGAYGGEYSASAFIYAGF